MKARTRHLPPGDGVVTGQAGRRPQKPGPQRAWTRGPESTEHTRAFLSAHQEKSTPGEPMAEGGPSSKKSQSLALFPLLSLSLDTELIARRGG